MQEASFHYGETQLSSDRRTVTFAYELQHSGQTYALAEQLVFAVPLSDSAAQMNSLRALHLALGISYYKIFVPRHITHPYAMDAQEAEFWNDVWRNGLGEFLYVNKLSVDSLASFTEQAGQSWTANDAMPKQVEGALLGIGGGKDSIVAGELLKQIGVESTGFVMATGEQRGQAQAVADTMQIPLLAVERTLDTQLLSLQESADAYKGHVPISLIFGLVGTALAIALGKQYVVVANEASASIPRVMHENMPVNHQWSKSFGFEQKLQNFIHQRVAAEVTYFSAVRQLTSVGVAKLFARLPQYFEVFTSDNFVFRIDPSKRPNGRWSLESPKSLSSYMLLAPWISEPDMLRIFGSNLLDEPVLEKLFMELTGVEGKPPLDCVGTVDELILSLNLAYRQHKFTSSRLVQLGISRGVIDESLADPAPDWDTLLAKELRLQPEETLPPVLREQLIAQLQAGLES